MNLATLTYQSIIAKYPHSEVFTMLREENIKVVQGLLPTGIDGMAVTAWGQKYIYINNLLNLEQQRIVAAKGLGHHLMNPEKPVSFTSSYQASIENTKYEDHAEQFASFLLKIENSSTVKTVSMAR